MANNNFQSEKKGFQVFQNGHFVFGVEGYLYLAESFVLCIYEDKECTKLIAIIPKECAIRIYDVLPV